MCANKQEPPLSRASIEARLREIAEELAGERGCAVVEVAKLLYKEEGAKEFVKDTLHTTVPELLQGDASLRVADGRVFVIAPPPAAGGAAAAGEDAPAQAHEPPAGGAGGGGGGFGRLAVEMDKELLTTRMWRATKEVHSKSDSITSMKAAIALTDRKLWGQAIGWFYLVISQIEASLQRSKAKHAAIPAVLESYDLLSRTAAFESDLVVYLGSEWRSKLTVPPAVEEYQQHIKSLEQSDPLMLVCYYFHFMGALTGGGPIIKRMVTNSLRLKKGGAGVRLFEFEDDKGKVFFQDLKRVVNGLRLSEEEEERLIREGMSVFERNDTIVQCVTKRIGWTDMLSSVRSPPVQVLLCVFAVAVAVITQAFWF